MAISIGGSLSQGSSSSSSTTSGRETGTQTVQRLSDESLALTQRLAQLFGAQAGEQEQTFTRRNALEDVEGIIGNLFTQYSETALPQIFSAISGGGGYNSTSGQMLANDAFARTTAQAGEVAINAISQYEQLALQRRQISLAGLEAALQSEIAGREDTEFDTTFTSSTRSRGSSSGGGIGFGFSS